MKKLIFLVLFTLFVSAGLTGCSGKDEPYTEKTYTSENVQIKSVGIDVRDREVEVTISPDEKIHITYYENSKETYDISVSEDNVLTMNYVSNKEWTDYIGGKASEDYRKISVQIPKSKLDSLSVSTTNEDINVTEAAFNESVALKANGGDISFEDLSAGKEITLDVKNGNISGDIAGSYDDYAISCSVKKGESNLPAAKENGVKKLTVTANNGDVDVNIG